MKKTDKKQIALPSFFNALPTCRDRFAEAALQVILRCAYPFSKDRMDSIAAKSYEIADAMMAARGQTPMSIDPGEFIAFSETIARHLVQQTRWPAPPSS